MNNNLIELNKKLFDELERLGDLPVNSDKLESELNRANGIATIASNIINNGRLSLEAMKHLDEYGYQIDDKPEDRVPELFKSDEGSTHVKKIATKR